MKDNFTLSSEDRQQLLELIEVAQNAGHSTADFAAQRLSACIEIGAKLTAYKKQVPHGSWEHWLSDQFGDRLHYNVDTLRRWMRLAKCSESGKLNLQSSQGLRAAYIDAGILPANNEEKAFTQRAQPAYLLLAIRLAGLLQRLTASNLVNIKQLREALRPIVLFYEKLPPTKESP